MQTNSPEITLITLEEGKSQQSGHLKLLGRTGCLEGQLVNLLWVAVNLLDSAQIFIEHQLLQVLPLQR